MDWLEGTISTNGRQKGSAKNHPKFHSSSSNGYFVRDQLYLHVNNSNNYMPSLIKLCMYAQASTCQHVSVVENTVDCFTYEVCSYPTKEDYTTFQAND